MGDEMYRMKANNDKNVMAEAYHLENEKLLLQTDIIAKPDLLITNQNPSTALQEYSEPLNRMIKNKEIKQCLQDENYR